MELIAKLKKGKEVDWQMVSTGDGRIAAHIWGTVKDYEWTERGRAIITVEDSHGQINFLWAEVVIIEYVSEAMVVRNGG